MFNIFPKFGSPGDCASTDDLIGKPATNWFYTSTPTFTINGKTYKADEISQYIGELIAENQKLKNELEGWKIGNKNWRKLYDEKADTVDELNKEVKNLRHLKEENIQLMERVNEIDSDQNEEYRAEILALKNDYAVLKAKYQILDHNYQGCTKYRDEYKHQLNAANKEIEALKSKLRDYQDKYAESFSHNDMDKLQKEIDQLKRWKKEQLTVQSWWDKVDKYVRDHDDAPLGGIVANTCLNFLKERDELKAEVKKLKEDIVDYVIEKDDELKKAQDWNNLKQRKTHKVCVCNHCGYKVGHSTNYWGGCGFCKEGLMIEREEVIDWMSDEGIPNDEEAETTIDTLKNMKTQGFEDYDPKDYVDLSYEQSVKIAEMNAKKEQKHPMYPIHWGGWDGAASAFPEEYSKWLNKQKEDTLKEKKEEGLAVRVAKLEEQLKYIQKINFKE